MLTLRGHFRACRLPELCACDRSAESAAKVRFAVELNVDVADDILPKRQSPAPGHAVCRELDRHVSAPYHIDAADHQTAITEGKIHTAPLPAASTAVEFLFPGSRALRFAFRQN